MIIIIIILKKKNLKNPRYLEVSVVCLGPRIAMEDVVVFLAVFVLAERDEPEDRRLQTRGKG